MELLERIQSLLCRQGIISDLKEDSLSTGIFTGAIGSRLRLSENSGLLHCMVVIPIFTPEYRRPAMAQGTQQGELRTPRRLLSDGIPVDHSIAQDGLDLARFAHQLPDTKRPHSKKIATNSPRRCLFWSQAIACCSVPSTQHQVALVEVAFTEIEPEVAVARAEASWQEEQQAVAQ